MTIKVPGTPEERKYFIRLCHAFPQVLRALVPSLPRTCSKTGFRTCLSDVASLCITTVRRCDMPPAAVSAKKSKPSDFKIKLRERASELAKTLRKNPLAAGPRLRDLADVKCSTRTVRRDLASFGYVWRSRPKAQRLLEGDAADRLVAARRLKRTDVKKLRFSDEAWVTTNETCRRGQWLKRGQHATPLLQEQYPPKFLLWGCVGIGYKRLIVLPQQSKVTEDGENTMKMFRLSGEQYQRRILGPCKADLTGRLFVQDGAPCHRKKSVKTWILKQGIDLFDPWPARSPDLNPIEKIWAELKRAVSERRPRNAEELLKAIRDCWAELPQWKIDRTVQGVKGCAGACVKAGGGLFGRRREDSAAGKKQKHVVTSAKAGDKKKGRLG